MIPSIEIIWDHIFCNVISCNNGGGVSYSSSSDVNSAGRRQLYPPHLPQNFLFLLLPSIAYVCGNSVTILMQGSSASSTDYSHLSNPWLFALITKKFFRSWFMIEKGIMRKPIWIVNCSTSLNWIMRTRAKLYYPKVCTRCNKIIVRSANIFPGFNTCRHR